ncbi:hypothetical protein NS14008_04535 [Nocardia seriolae]|nr:hypothetical protein NS14008_04535 [Nocardia seriolae]PSK33070.1 hypothetical protein C6575_02125 [Nocardia seriolae]RLP33890.1 hypothetical protein D6158_00520 [Nocardia seriolae]
MFRGPTALPDSPGAIHQPSATSTNSVIRTPPATISARRRVALPVPACALTGDADPRIVASFLATAVLPIVA